MIALPELVLAAQHGDTSAFGEIVRRFTGLTLRIGIAMLSDHARAEDAAQEAFLDAYLSLHNLRDVAAFPGWFRRIVFKHCERQLRRDHGEVPLAQISFDGDGAPDMFDTLYMRTRMHDALASLSKRQRTLVQLFYVDGYSQRELVTMLGWSLPTIKKQLFLARTSIREEMYDMRYSHQTPNPTAETAQRVEFFLALHARDVTRITQLATQARSLLSIYTEWADLDNRNYWPLGYTALHYAAGIGDVALSAALIAAGADLNAPSKNNFATPLHVAIMQQHVDLIEHLLAAGANIGAANCNGQSALHFAAYRGNTRITQALLTAGAAPSLKDAGGRTPLDWAIHRGHLQVADLLRQAGGNTAVVPSQALPLPDLDRTGPILETRIKLIDLFAPLARGAANALFTPLSGVGKVVVLEQLIDTIASQYHGRTLFLGIETARYTGPDFAIELNDVGLADAADLFFASSLEQRTLIDTVTRAFAQIDPTRETLIMVDAQYAEVDGLQAMIEAAATGNVTVLWYGDHTAGVEPATFDKTAAVVSFETWRALNSYWPAIDPTRSHSKLITGRHAELVRQTQRLLRRFEDLRFILERDPRGMDALSSDADRVLAGRARKLHAFLSQPFSITELWTNTIGEYVPLAWALDGVEAVLDGNLDDVDEAQLRSIAGTHLKIRR